MAWLPWLADGELPSQEWLQELYTAALERFAAAGVDIYEAWHQPFIDSTLVYHPRIAVGTSEDFEVKYLWLALAELAKDRYAESIEDDVQEPVGKYSLVSGVYSVIEAARNDLGHQEGTSAHVPNFYTSLNPLNVGPLRLTQSRHYNLLRRLIQRCRYLVFDQRSTAPRDIGVKQPPQDVSSNSDDDVWDEAKTTWENYPETVNENTTADRGFLYNLAEWVETALGSGTPEWRRRIATRWADYWLEQSINTTALSAFTFVETDGLIGGTIPEEDQSAFPDHPIRVEVGDRSVIVDVPKSLPTVEKVFLDAGAFVSDKIRVIPAVYENTDLLDAVRVPYLSSYPNGSQSFYAQLRIERPFGILLYVEPDFTRPFESSGVPDYSS